MKYTLVYITTSNAKEAEKIGKTLVKEKLAACANVLPKMRSIYRWKGKVKKATEAVLLVKTRKTLSKKVIARVKKLHSYDCPCVVALDITEGNAAYLLWIAESTNSA